MFAPQRLARWIQNAEKTRVGNLGICTVMRTDSILAVGFKS